MRVGFDMLAVQSPHHGHRGIGRYARHLVQAMIDRADGHQYFLYVHGALPGDRIPDGTNATTHLIGPAPEHGPGSASQHLNRLARDNPDSLDVLVVLSAFEHWNEYLPPGPHPGGPKLAAVVYDMIPFLAPDGFYAPKSMPRFYRCLEHLRRYDALLAISESTRADALALMGLPGDQVVNISAASDPLLFAPAEGPMSEPERRTLRLLGITRPFVLNVGGMDPRKNPWGLIDAFALLPEGVRWTHQLVFTFELLPEEALRLRQYAEAKGVGDAVVLTGEGNDRQLRVLYQRCAAFAFPSSYEGFGLPILEAMQSGAPVIAGDNSSQPEVVGRAGLLADAGDPADFAEKIGRVLTDPGLAATLRRHAVEHAARFSWGQTATRAVSVLETLPTRRPPARRRAAPGHARRPRIAFFSPLPPCKSGISDYSTSLLHELRRTYAIDVYHDSGYIPDLGVSQEFVCRDHRTFERYAAAVGYHAAVYQMGNSHYHNYLYPILMRVPGVVTLHDFCLVGFHMDYGHRFGMGRGYLAEELLGWYPGDADKIRSRLDAWSLNWERGAIERACVGEGWYLNGRLLASRNHIIVHSPWCLNRILDQQSELADRVAVIPHGASARRPNDAERGSIRNRFGIPDHALVVASFGFVHPDKMCPEALDAFAEVARDNPAALFAFVGEDADGGGVRRHVESLGLRDRVRFFGRRTLSEFVELASITDVGINLRRPPTNGETSGALLYLLSSGAATIVTDVATFSDYPDGVVHKVRWDEDGPERLRQAMRRLIADRHAREAMGRAAWEHVRSHHEWPRVADRYVEAIERCHADFSSGAAARVPLPRTRTRSRLQRIPDGVDPCKGVNRQPAVPRTLIGEYGA